MNKAALLDRDGVINRKAPEAEYITRWSEMLILPGVAQAISLLNKAGYLVIIVTNQRCVARGLITTSDLESIHQRLCKTLADAGASINAVYYCPHEVAPACGCRKPAAGMLLEASRQHDLDLAASWMVGDSTVDISAGKTAGCKTALLSDSAVVKEEADVLASSLLDAVHQILSRPQ